jgi:hypothetical protein
MPVPAPVIIIPSVPDIYIYYNRTIPAVPERIVTPVVVVITVVGIVPSVIIPVAPAIVEAETTSAVDSYSPGIRLVIVPVCLGEHRRIVAESSV